MLRLTRRSEYGLMALAYLARRHGTYCSVREIVANLGIPRRLLAEILKDLSHYQIVRAVRGPGGGYRLRKDPDQLSLAEIVTALEGTPFITDCANGGDCQMEPVCIINGGINQVAEQIQAVLESFTLEQIAKGSDRPAEATSTAFGVSSQAVSGTAAADTLSESARAGSAPPPSQAPRSADFDHAR
ncbi:MAG: Rrf2 family transcriptional regulator [Planctomycetota bacterium]|nr:MAG: Rrf2 family transcriptional regulator [Planctomycetota bacterium]